MRGAVGYRSLHRPLADHRQRHSDGSSEARPHAGGYTIQLERGKAIIVDHLRVAGTAGRGEESATVPAATDLMTRPLCGVGCDEWGWPGLLWRSAIVLILGWMGARCACWSWSCEVGQLGHSGTIINQHSGDSNCCCLRSCVKIRSATLWTALLTDPPSRAFPANHLVSTSRKSNRTTEPSVVWLRPGLDWA